MCEYMLVEKDNYNFEFDRTFCHILVFDELKLFLFVRIHFFTFVFSFTFLYYQQNGASTSFLVNGRETPLILSPHHGCCWQGDERSQGVSSYAYGIMIPKFSITKRCLSHTSWALSIAYNKLLFKMF